jgi:hypothetical protein
MSSRNTDDDYVAYINKLRTVNIIVQRIARAIDREFTDGPSVALLNEIRHIIDTNL